MPKTAVNEDSDARTCEGDVRLPWERANLDSIPQSTSVQLAA